MRVSILRNFPHSRDGVKILHAVAGTEDDIADNLVPGLEGAGLVSILRIEASTAQQPAQPEQRQFTRRNKARR